MKIDEFLELPVSLMFKEFIRALIDILGLIFKVSEHCLVCFGFEPYY